MVTYTHCVTRWRKLYWNHIPRQTSTVTSLSISVRTSSIKMRFLRWSSRGCKTYGPTKLSETIVLHILTVKHCCVIRSRFPCSLLYVSFMLIAHSQRLQWRRHVCRALEVVYSITYRFFRMLSYVIMVLNDALYLPYKFVHEIPGHSVYYILLSFSRITALK